MLNSKKKKITKYSSISISFFIQLRFLKICKVVLFRIGTVECNSLYRTRSVDLHNSSKLLIVLQILSHIVLKPWINTNDLKKNIKITNEFNERKGKLYFFFSFTKTRKDNIVLQGKRELWTVLTIGTFAYKKLGNSFMKFSILDASPAFTKIPAMALHFD